MGEKYTEYHLPPETPLDLQYKIPKRNPQKSADEIRQIKTEEAKNTKEEVQKAENILNKLDEV